MIRKNENAELVAIADVDVKQKAIAENDFATKYYISADELLANENDLDVVNIFKKSILSIQRPNQHKERSGKMYVLFQILKIWKRLRGKIILIF